MSQDQAGDPPFLDDEVSNCSEPQWIPVRSLLPADSPRHAGEDAQHIEMLARIDAQLPPIIVHRQTMGVIDGMHRLGAARMRGDETIQVRFFDGTEQEAFVLAVRRNIAHGLPLSYDDRARAAERILQSHPGWSDRTIAAAVGLSARTIGNFRRRLPSERQAAERARTGLDGRVRPLNRAEGRLRASELIQQRPGASLREIAREIGISPSTVRDVRQRIERGDDPLPAGRQSRDRHEAPAAPAVDAPPGTDPVAMLEGLQNDPSLRENEVGRGVLRWMFARAIRTDEWIDVVDKVPPHVTYLIADLARRCAEEWRHLAEDLERRGASDA